MMNLRTLVRASTILLLMVSFASAKQYKSVYSGREVVVHTNPIPVILHRLVPPQYGRHVTAREIQTGTVPAPGRLVGTTRGR